MTHKLPAIICDLDNTLCHIGERNPYAAHLCHTDTCNEALYQLLYAMRRIYRWRLLLLTGRNERARQATIRWLDGHKIEYDRLFMRSPDDWRPGCDYKREVYEEHIAPCYEVRLAFEDDPAIVAMFRELGLTCFAVADFRVVECTPLAPIRFDDGNSCVSAKSRNR